MRLKQIASRGDAKRFLPSYLADHNRRFVSAPQAPEDFHTAVPEGLDLDEIFRLEETRTISNDWVVSYHSRLFQIRRKSRQHAPARSKVTVCEWPNGRIASTIASNGWNGTRSHNGRLSHPRRSSASHPRNIARAGAA